MSGCPSCGGTKMDDSELCQACRVAENARKARERMVCPRCGGYKKATSHLCRTCRTETATFLCRICSRRTGGEQELCSRCIEGLVPITRLRPIVEEWIGDFPSRDAACELLARTSGMTDRTWARRLSGTWTGTNRGWWTREFISIVEADEFFAAADLVHLWHLELADLYEGATVAA